MGFDGQMINLLADGDVAGAKVLIMNKYPGISKYRVSTYINAYHRLIIARKALRKPKRIERFIINPDKKGNCHPPHNYLLEV
jgi:hypothetical protein